MPIMFNKLSPSLLALVALSYTCLAQANDYETISPADSSQYFPGAADSTVYSLSADVQSDGFINQYRLDSATVGELNVHSTEFTRERMHELEIILALSEIKQTDAFIQGFQASVDTALKATEQALNDPVEAVKNLEKGFSRFIDNVGATVSDLGKKASDNDKSKKSSEKSLIKEFLGVNSAKRRLATDFGVDPYSSNEVLQKSLEDVATAIVAGGASLDVALQSAPGAAGAVRQTASMMEEGSQHYLLFSPRVLRFKIKEHLASDSFPAEQLDELLDNTQCSVRHVTTMAGVLLSIDLPGINQAVFTWTLAAEDENECRRRMHMMELVWGYGRRKKISDLWIKNNQLYWRDTVDTEGIAIVADQLFWTSRLEKLLGELESIYKVAWVSGTVSDKARLEIGNRGIKLSANRFKRLKERENIGNNILEGSALPELETPQLTEKPIPETEQLAAPKVFEDTPVEEEAIQVRQAVEEQQAPPVDEVEVLTEAESPAPEQPGALETNQAEQEQSPVTLSHEEPTLSIPPVEETTLPAEPVEEPTMAPLLTKETSLPTQTVEEAVIVPPPVKEPVKPAPVIKKAEAKKEYQPGCWQHPKLGRFRFKQKGNVLELGHEIPNRAEIRHFTLRSVGSKHYWKTGQVEHVFVQDVGGLKLFTNIHKDNNEISLEKCPK